MGSLVLFVSIINIAKMSSEQLNCVAQTKLQLIGMTITKCSMLILV